MEKKPTSCKECGATPVLKSWESNDSWRRGNQKTTHYQYVCESCHVFGEECILPEHARHRWNRGKREKKPPRVSILGKLFKHKKSRRNK